MVDGRDQKPWLASYPEGVPEFAPKPPFDTGSVEKAPPMLVQMLKERMAPREA